MSEYVGSGIINIITESLYDNPIVVFREYVQNSVDSIFKKNSDAKDSSIKIWNSGKNVCFLDNGDGIAAEEFQLEMCKIGASSKKKQINLGYKGIGRLAGLSYCQNLIFVNINDYKHGLAQMFTIDGEKYRKNIDTEEYRKFSFEELMNEIGQYETFSIEENQLIYNEIKKYDDMLLETNKGFLVLLKNITEVLNATIKNKKFISQLNWLLPVDFETDIYNSDVKELFNELTYDEKDVVPVRFCKIWYNDIKILRPIRKEMLRDYVCKSNFKYATGFHTFRGDKICIDSKNEFSGIRVYIDNMLLCDEKELLQSLENYGLLSHTMNGQIQSVRGIGAMIYITDKINICANARRTFIEVTDNDSLEFLKLLAEFVNTIYDTRYALSDYFSFKEKQIDDENKLKILKQNALDNLRKLAKEDIELPIETTQSFKDLSLEEKKREIKKNITQEFNSKLKKFLCDLSGVEQMNNINDKVWFESFLQWIIDNYQRN